MRTEFKNNLIVAIWEDYNQYFFTKSYNENPYFKACKHANLKDLRRLKAKTNKNKNHVVKLQKARNQELFKQLQWVFKLN